MPSSSSTRRLVVLVETISFLPEIVTRRCVTVLNVFTMMNLREKTLIFVTFLTSCLAIALISAGLGTQYWIVAKAFRSTNEKSKGLVHFGLFQGERKLNHGFGERIYSMDILDVMFHEQKYMVKELFITTIACAVGGIFFGVISALLSILNTASNPVEAVCHYTGK